MAEQNVMDASSDGNQDYVTSGGDFGNDYSGDQGGADAGTPGMGQSKSSRRRRRKRKNKGGPSAGGDGASPVEAAESSPAVPVVMQGESLALAASAAAPQRRQQAPAGAQQPQPGQGQSQSKRWKKKHRDRERRSRPANENPGNDFRSETPQGGGFAAQVYGQNGNFGNGGNFGGGNFKRKNKGGGGGGGGQQRKDRGFVGPMDHSYREVNGNFADSPPSTIQLRNGNPFGRKHRQHHGDSQPIDHNMPRPIPIPENAQTHIYFFIEDLFFTAKIQETARKLGVKVAFLKTDKEALDALTSGEDTDKPALIVFDLNNANAKPLTTIPKLRTKLKKSSSIIGFLSHLQGDLKAKGIEAGCDVVMPRAAFSQALPNLLRRYSVEEGEEINYNQ